MPEPEDDARPTMAGWTWRDRELPDNPVPSATNGASAIRSALFSWPEGSDNWNAFIEPPHQDDLLPLFKHLGLEVYDISIPQGRDRLAARLDHPGIAMFDMPSVRRAHAVYVPHLRGLLYRWPTPDGLPRTGLPTFGWPPGPEHLKYGPRLFWVVVDIRQPRRA